MCYSKLKMFPGCPDSWRCTLLMDAMDHIHQSSCVRFKEWTSEPNKIHIFLNPERYKFNAHMAQNSLTLSVSQTALFLQHLFLFHLSSLQLACVCVCANK